MFSIFKKSRSLRKSVRSVNAPIYYINEEPIYHTPSEEELFENIYSDGLEVDEMTVIKAREGNEKDLLKIGYVYFSRHTRNDYLKALDWFMKSAEKNSAEAEFRIAELYDKGQGVEKDQAKSFEWCLRAANAGHIDALNKMGWSYLEGWGVPVDKKGAIYWFTKAADQGDWIAQEQLDSLREDDLSVFDDIKLDFADDDYRLESPQEEEIELPMEMTENKTTELKEIMLKYEKLQQELQAERQRRDEEIAKRDEEMRDMAKAIEVLQSSITDTKLDDAQMIKNDFTNGLVKSTLSLPLSKTESSKNSLESCTSYSEDYTKFDAVIRKDESVYVESPLEEQSDWKSEDGQDPNYDTPDEDEGQDPNYDSSTEEEGQDPNYDSPEEDDEDNESTPNIRFSTMQTKQKINLQINRSKTL